MVDNFVNSERSLTASVPATMLKRAVVSGGQQVLRSFKPKIQATKPKDTAKMVADGVVVGLLGCILVPKVGWAQLRLLKRSKLRIVRKAPACWLQRSSIQWRRLEVSHIQCARMVNAGSSLTRCLSQIVASVGAIAEILLRLKAKVRHAACCA